MTVVVSKQWSWLLGGAGLLGLFATVLSGQQEVHGRKYQPPPQIAHIVVTVVKGFNDKPLSNAAVVFHATKDGKSDGNLEIKTDPDGHAVMDFIEAGSHVTVQVIASGYATYAEDFDTTAADKEIHVRMLRPRAQISDYVDNDGKASQDKPGIQEHVKPASPPTPAQTGAPAATTVPPPVDSPQTTPTAPAVGTQAPPAGSPK